MRPFAWLAPWVLLAVACSSDPDPDAGTPPDSGGAIDGGADDSGPSDSGAPDVSLGLTIDVTGVFPAGTRLKDGYSGNTGTVDNEGKVQIQANPRGVVLLERDQTPGPEATFRWDNATVYFVVTDRFFNGDPSNDNSYGRQTLDGIGIGGWHGGDLAGLTQKLDHLEALGINAIWITPPVEQVHGWVGGGAGEFQHFAYHGYWALDFTKLDANLGDEDDLTTFVDAAHDRGIRVVFDVVLNHPGYATGADLAAYLPSVIDPNFAAWRPGAGQTWQDWNALVNYNSNDWVNWWGPRWIRAGFPGHSSAGQDDLRMSLAFLPDFITEDFRPVTDFPGILTAKGDSNAVPDPNATLRQYLVKWHSDWVRQYGIDGFRCDTAKHVEKATWSALKQASVTALDEWKAAHPNDKLDDLDFWMTGEVFPHGVVKDDYFTNGFDSLINFDFQTQAKMALADNSRLDSIYSMYAQAINTDPSFNVLSYISSHDTELFYGSTNKNLDAQFRVGTQLMLLPGAVQIYYGDETAREPGPNSTDPKQATRSDMNWDNYDAALLAHWQKLGQFRNRHVAVGAGSHRSLAQASGYAFAREYDQNGVSDQVVVYFAP